MYASLERHREWTRDGVGAAIAKVGTKIISRTGFVPGHMLTAEAKDKYGEGGVLFYVCLKSGRKEERIIPWPPPTSNPGAPSADLTRRER